MGQKSDCRPGSYLMSMDWQGGKLLEEMCGHCPSWREHSSSKRDIFIKC